MTLPANEPSIELDKLFHYSTPGGLNGILNSRSIWMTNILYQNDIEEYRYADQIFREVMLEYTVDFSKRTLYPLNTSHTFTFSLSENEDLLSQWRGYSPNGGFAFAFNKNLLAKAIEDNGLKLIKCMYDKNEQKDFIRSIIKITSADFIALKAKVEQNLANVQENKTYEFYLSNFDTIGLNFWQEAARFKHPKFAEEREWRLIKSDSKIGSIKLREAKDILIPYIEIPLAEKDAKNLFASIKVGPSSRQNLARYAFNYVIHSTDITVSEIPYRSW